MTAACPACSVGPAASALAAGPGLQFSLPTVHCAACIGKIERGMASVIGVQDVRVNLSLKRLSVTGHVDPERVLTALAGLGFEAYPLDASAMSRARDDQGRALLTRMAVAGFAMMNIMLLSIAVWSGAEDATRDLFHLISGVIALPVVAYAGQPFYINAWQALRVGRMNMDVPISLAILLAAGMSLFETLNGGHHAYFDAAVSLTFFLLIGRYMDHTTRSAARSAAKELTALEVHSADLMVAGKVQTVNVADLAVGDIVMVPAGARVPVDGTLVAASALLDRSILTGETAAIDAKTGDALQAGEINLSAPFRMRATAVGEDSSLRRMAALVETAENARNSYTALADRAAAIYAPAVHLLALTAFLGWMVYSGDVRLSINIAIAVLIITCPCALGLAVPAVSTAAISRLFSNGFLVKHGTALERIAEVDYILFDKTGTLTLPSVEIPATVTAADRAAIKTLAQASHHPMSKALVAALGDADVVDLHAITEVAGEGITGQWGAQTLRLGRGAWLGADFTGMGFQRGDAAPVMFVASETLRPGVVEAIAGMGLPCEVITGDTAGPAQKLGDLLGLKVTADARPADKLRRLEELKAEGYHVLMIGDGLNDTAALAAAHASIAPAKALEASRSASDIVVLKDSFADLPLILSVSRGTKKLSQQNFRISTIYNLISVPLAIMGFCTPLAAALSMSISSITVLLNAQRMRWM